MKKDSYEKEQINKGRISNDVAAFMASGGVVTKIKKGATSLQGGHPSRRNFDKTLEGKVE